MVKQLQAAISSEQLLEIQTLVSKVHIAPTLVDYVQKLLAHSRDSGLFHCGLSPRSGQGLLRAAQAWAFIEGREQVLPEDVQAVLPSVAEHRLQAREEQVGSDFINELITQVSIP